LAIWASGAARRLLASEDSAAIGREGAPRERENAAQQRDPCGALAQEEQRDRGRDERGGAVDDGDVGDGGVA